MAVENFGKILMNKRSMSTLTTALKLNIKELKGIEQALNPLNLDPAVTIDQDKTILMYYLVLSASDMMVIHLKHHDRVCKSTDDKCQEFADQLNILRIKLSTVHSKVMSRNHAIRD